ncbi:TIGR04197 family type VII secretion effector [Streptococcus oricebi]|uniref:TIGR04197 family type VII secretion effector n=1 Tax=Streptococcus oricebi TaxID=1547447 RepID=A0ABS5B302_9STRE|nr:TIGR04197 family type VII secretion effector [Streptococcus oricebi]MBP2623217.1 hypothetical protein [Streptococcus oricebi]
MTIQSNQMTASGHASAIMAGASLMVDQAVTKDTTSNFDSNTSLQSYMDQEADSASQSAEQTRQLVAGVQATAREFVATDTQIKAQLDIWRLTDKIYQVTAPARKDHVASSAPLPGTETLQKAGLGYPLN